MMRVWLLAVAARGLAPANDLVVRAARCQPVERTPVWLFRQAGRHMPEYREYKEQTGKQFLELLKDPLDVAEVTMQPLRRYDVDAAILFSDILVLAQALGIDVTMPGGVGIQVPRPIETPDHASYIADLAAHDPEWLVRTNLRHVTRAVTEIRAAQLREGRDVTLLGFSAAPWTLLYYVLGSSSKKVAPARDFFKSHPAACERLMDALEDLIVEYLSAQVDHGAHAVQVFEAMAGALDARTFSTFAAPRLVSLAHKFKRRHPDVPLFVFARGANQEANQALASHYDVITLDTTANRRDLRSKVDCCLQGNLDPKLLVNADADSPSILEKEVSKMLMDFALGPLIANLGEGLAGTEDPLLVKAFVDAVHQY
ncbi:hypothetical protein CTAYLR_005698 [Chrysophaeum taylorii]|uniref:Uroporphyrinogen decarboxylase (URO-D) domain-containing protein n=1 Tax=Chrysophaeum taylorii TaxID=2483200 RepID=A0AAD7UB15_9STRA|nr:hypothetical protein CTAYLR_005698 [Chrysophaeum taylorii]